MSAAEITCPVVTATPSSSSVPLAGSVSMRTFASTWPASASVKAKFAVSRTTGVSSVPEIVASALLGGVLVPTLTVSVAVALPPLPSLTV